MAGEKVCFEQRRLADLLADFAGTAPLCDNFLPNAKSSIKSRR
jgi:hypothetical protein